MKKLMPILFIMFVGCGKVRPQIGYLGGRYFCLALNGYGIGWPGEDRNIYGYTSTDGLTWTDAG